MSFYVPIRNHKPLLVSLARFGKQFGCGLHSDIFAGPLACKNACWRAFSNSFDIPLSTYNTVVHGGIDVFCKNFLKKFPYFFNIGEFYNVKTGKRMDAESKKFDVPFAVFTFSADSALPARPPLA